MKKRTVTVLMAAATIIAMTTTSCKKSYSCECVTTYTDGAGDSWTLTKIDPIDEKMKDKQASAACAATQDQMKYVNDDLNADPTGPYVDITSTCKVK